MRQTGASEKEREKENHSNQGGGETDRDDVSAVSFEMAPQRKARFRPKLFFIVQ